MDSIGPYLAQRINDEVAKQMQPLRQTVASLQAQIDELNGLSAQNHQELIELMKIVDQNTKDSQRLVERMKHKPDIQAMAEIREATENHKAEVQHLETNLSKSEASHRQMSNAVVQHRAVMQQLSVAVVQTQQDMREVIGRA
eukprot:TRINITY_DN50668_c0_g1_i1.p1 TRINITY_DN50668_c0_g1~~TRINITY_DN50668_c0_g1_i1.p1  ORF type:complete len:156 (+),score=34.88 TRINITY_DN50668_c0_g1_i1:45-470(+)